VVVGGKEASAYSCNFCGGTPEKVLITKEKLPKAIYCSNEKLLTTLEKVKQ
jgi:hypothetical protein